MKRASLSTMYGIGLLGIAPGTAGSLVAALLAYLILLLPHGYVWLMAGTALFAIIGTWHAARFMRDRHTTHDPQEIVIDELVGQWFTYVVWFTAIAFVSPNATYAAKLLDTITISPLYLFVGFLLFRFFDIVKPWPISLADRRIRGGFGVMFDDILAAIPAGLLLYAAQVFSPVLLGQTLEVNP